MATGYLKAVTGDRPVDPELLKQLESALLSADLGVRTTKEVLAALRQQVNEHKLEEPGALKRELKNQILKIQADIFFLKFYFDLQIFSKSSLVASFLSV